MTSGYYAACTGLISRTESLETIANNLANVSTAGFRGRHNIFSSVLASTGNALSTLNQDTNDYGVLGATRLDTTQGALERTGNDLDLAIEGPAYFAVQTPTGTAYTRGGNLRVSPQGQLTTASGDALLGDNGSPITVIGAPLSISADGTISVKGALAGKLQLVEFGPAVELQSAGNMIYTAPTGSATSATNSNIRQGMIETSNVNPVTSVVELITAQREVETMRRVLSMFNNEIDKVAAQDLPRVS